MEKQTIRFAYNPNKAKQTVLWLLQKHRGALNKLKLVKLTFYADREHLFRYGRPIFGGHYCAMQHGPVSSELLNEIDSAGQVESLPFSLNGKKVTAKQEPDLTELSESDLEILNEVNRKYGGFIGWHLRNLTHTLKCWNKNYPDKSANTSHLLPYEDFFLDTDDNSILDIIRDDQEAWAGLN